MKKSIISLPGHRVHEYLLVLHPRELWQPIRTIKKEFAEKYKVELARRTMPHVTLIHFCASEMREKRIINKLGMIGSGVTPFEVELRNFGSFPTGAIYINIATKFFIQDLVNQLKLTRPLLTSKNEKRPYFSDNPHITICRALNPFQLAKAWDEYSQRRFSGLFVADSMILLKRSHGEKEYEAIMRFEFKGVPMLAKQASLFM